MFRNGNRSLILVAYFTLSEALKSQKTFEGSETAMRRKTFGIFRVLPTQEFAYTYFTLP